MSNQGRDLVGLADFLFKKKITTNPDSTTTKTMPSSSSAVTTATTTTTTTVTKMAININHCRLSTTIKSLVLDYYHYLATIIAIICLLLFLYLLIQCKKRFFASQLPQSRSQNETRQTQIKIEAPAVPAVHSIYSFGSDTEYAMNL